MGLIAKITDLVTALTNLSTLVDTVQAKLVAFEAFLDGTP